jgi:uncharacterized protein (TIGR03437 family)
MYRLHLAIGFLAIGTAAQTQQVAPAPATLEIDVVNIVSYTSDVFDASKFATDPSLTTVTVPARNFGFVIAVGDIVAVNGTPAKGTLIARQQALVLNPTPNPGQGVADTVRTAVTEFLLEIQQVDGSPVGNIYTLALSGGTAPLGLSRAAVTLGASLNSNHVIAGGTGAFIGARGQAASVVLPGNVGPRIASMTEDPSRRRDHGGGKVHFVFQLYPMTRPEIVLTGSEPAIAHAAEFLPVNAANPAKPGEILSLWATGLGPTDSALNFGEPFPATPLSAVNSPIELTVNGQPAEVIGAVGYPGSTDRYQVNFRIPADAVTGMASILLSAAWIKGNPVQIPIQ